MRPDARRAPPCCWQTGHQALGASGPGDPGHREHAEEPVQMPNFLSAPGSQRTTAEQRYCHQQQLRQTGPRSRSDDGERSAGPPREAEPRKTQLWEQPVSSKLPLNFCPLQRKVRALRCSPGLPIRWSPDSRHSPASPAQWLTALLAHTGGCAARHGRGAHRKRGSKSSRLHRAQGPAAALGHARARLVNLFSVKVRSLAPLACPARWHPDSFPPRLPTWPASWSAL